MKYDETREPVGLFEDGRRRKTFVDRKKVTEVRKSGHAVRNNEKADGQARLPQQRLSNQSRR